MKTPVIHVNYMYTSGTDLLWCLPEVFVGDILDY